MVNGDGEQSSRMQGCMFSCLTFRYASANICRELNAKRSRETKLGSRANHWLTVGISSLGLQCWRQAVNQSSSKTGTSQCSSRGPESFGVGDEIAVALGSGQGVRCRRSMIPARMLRGIGGGMQVYAIAFSVIVSPQPTRLSRV